MDAWGTMRLYSSTGGGAAGKRGEGIEGAFVECLACRAFEGISGERVRRHERDFEAERRGCHPDD